LINFQPRVTTLRAIYTGNSNNVVEATLWVTHDRSLLWRYTDLGIWPYWLIASHVIYCLYCGVLFAKYLITVTGRRRVDSWEWSWEVSDSNSRTRRNSILFDVWVCIKYKSEVALSLSRNSPAWSKDWLPLIRGGHNALPTGSHYAVTCGQKHNSFHTFCMVSGKSTPFTLRNKIYMHTQLYSPRRQPQKNSKQYKKEVNKSVTTFINATQHTYIHTQQCHVILTVWTCNSTRKTNIEHLSKQLTRTVSRWRNISASEYSGISTESDNMFIDHFSGPGKAIATRCVCVHVLTITFERKYL